ncbi:MAG: NADH-quinone oxidoreductase subunit N [Deltaproteobacteria bacterium]|nr:NADH-quinone oxidoreductase subunit N [Deltaproteobacteria bacterium]
MNFNTSLLLPELFQTIIVLILFVQALSRPGKEPNRPGWAARISWVPVAAALGIILAILSLKLTGSLFWDAYRVDGLSQFFKLAVTVGFTIAVLNATTSPTLEPNQRADYFLFLGLSALGLMLLASAVELITIFLALEISSYSLYALIPIRGKEPKAAEAGIKYILFGAAATAISLYGLSYILANQHSSYLQVLTMKDWSWSAAPLGIVGLTMFMAGFFYKLALFPFHFWCPDVYDGTSNETAAYAATLPKLGAVVILIRLSALLKPGMETITVLAVLGAFSMTFGNLSALVQKDLKRMLGYSSVAHAGYVMVGLVAVSSAGLAAAGFYSLIYLLMNLTCFWVICRLAVDGRNLEMDDLNGLYKREPFLAFILAVSAFALVGLPPTAGFMGKLFLLSAAWDRGYNWLIIVAALNTAISIYYYLNLVRHAYTAEAEKEYPAPRAGSAIFGGVLAAILLLLGTIPGPVFRFAEAAGKQLLP